MQALRALLEKRRRQLGLAIRRMQPLSPEEPQRLIENDAFKSRFSADEQQIVIGLSQVMTPYGALASKVRRFRSSSPAVID
jgi:hypothetical protein